MSFILLRHELYRTKSCPSILLIDQKGMVMCHEVAAFKLEIAVLSLLGKEQRKLAPLVTTDKLTNVIVGCLLEWLVCLCQPEAPGNCKRMQISDKMVESFKTFVKVT